MCEAGDLGVQDCQTTGDHVAELARAAGTGIRRPIPDEGVQAVGAATDVFQSETKIQEGADDFHTGHRGGVVLTLTGRGAGRGWQ